MTSLGSLLVFRVLRKAFRIFPEIFPESLMNMVEANLSAFHWDICPYHSIFLQFEQIQKTQADLERKII